jgi:SH3-like domain-containing protein
MHRSPRVLLFPLFILLLSAAPAGAKQVLVIAQTGLSLRVEPETSAERIQMLLTFEPVEVLEQKGEDWTRVKAVSSDKSGWVLSSYLSKTAFVTVQYETLNVRVGPGTEYAPFARVKKHYPFRVLKRDSDSGWLQVMDFDGDVGWITSNPTYISAEKPYVITQLDAVESNVRKGPGTEHEIVFTNTRGVLLEVLKMEDGWLNVRHEDGDQGWISAKIVFGWYDESTPHAGYPDKKKIIKE